jgi:hypothetical protein
MSCYNKDPITAQGISDAFRDLQGNQKAMDAFAHMNAGTISPPEFGAIAAAAQTSS